MRKRNHPDYNLVTYSYQIAEFTPPAYVFEFAKAQNQLWDDLVGLHDRLLETVKDLDKPARAVHYADFQKQCCNLVYGSSLTCHAQLDILDAFQVALKKFYKIIKSGNIAGPPSISKGLKRINLPYVSRTGGFAKEWLFRKKGPVTIHFEVNQTGNWETKGRFKLGDHWLDFTLYYHRDLPKNALIKRINLIGTHISTFGWQWKLNVLMEVPPDDQSAYLPLPATGRSCAIDLGFRIMDDYIRLGVGIDNVGRTFEFRLPLVFENSSRKRFREQLKKLNAEFQIPYISLSSLAHLSSHQFQVMAEYKQKLEALFPDMKPEYRPDPASWPLLKQQGLIRLKQAMEGYQQETGKQAIGLVLLNEWVVRNFRIQRDIATIWTLFRRIRDYAYWNLAKWLAVNFDTIYWEGDLSLKRIAEQEEPSFALLHAQKYRSWCGLSDLISKFKWLLKKHGRQLVGTPAAGTSLECHQCGADIPSSPKLSVVCDQGHEWDQDVNSAALIFKRCTKTQVRPRTCQPVHVPDHLKPFIAAL